MLLSIAKNMQSGNTAHVKKKTQSYNIIISQFLRKEIHQTTTWAYMQD